MEALPITNEKDPFLNQRKPQKAIWLAFVLALLVHAVLLLAPSKRQVGQPERRTSIIQIEVQYPNTQAPIEPLPEPPTEPPTLIEPTAQPVQQLAPTLADSPAVTVPPKPVQLPAEPPPSNDREESLQSADQLSRTILSSQFITEPSVTDKIFGPAIPDTGQAVVKEFHFPVRANMITMLDKPNPDLPFKYTEGLVHFAYDPGVKGDLQRFWDNITPEFGWRTNYGTEVKCVWVLVIAACGWGRTKE